MILCTFSWLLLCSSTHWTLIHAYMKYAFTHACHHVACFSLMRVAEREPSAVPVLAFCVGGCVVLLSEDHTTNGGVLEFPARS